MKPKLALSLLVCVGCGRCSSNAVVVADAGELQSALEAAAPIFAPSRCAPSNDAVAFDKLGVGEVVGDVALAGDRVIVSSLRSGVNSVGVAPASLDHVDWTSLGPAFGDAPAAVLATSGDRAYALSWERGDGSAARSLVITTVRPAVARTWSTTEPDASESFAVDAAFDGARGLVVWDTSRGIKVSTLVQGAPIVARQLSLEHALASAPRVVRRKADWVVVWSERKLDALPDGAPRTQPGEAIESPGEHRAYEWLSFAVVGDDGTTRVAPKRLTSDTGHAGRFDLLLAADDSVDVFVNDEADPGARDDVGGRILKLTLRGERVEPAVVVVNGGVGSGAPAAQRSTSTTWLFFEDSLGRARAQPGGDGSPLPSLEPALDDTRLDAPITADTWLGVSTTSLVRVRCVEASNGADH